MKLALGVDIGGSHITCQLYNFQKQSLIEGTKTRLTVDGNGSKNSILDSWEKAIQLAIDELGLSELAGIGFAMPGPFDYNNGVAWFDKNVGKFHSLHGVNVKAELIARLNLPSNFPVRFINDAASFAVGETSIQTRLKYKRILVLTLGTGFGSTFIKNGLPVAGKDGVPDDGFLYHVPFQNGIADEYFSTRWFMGEYKNVTGKEINGVKELANFYKTDSTARKLFSTFGNNLGVFLVPWINIFNAECIILGGNISKSLPHFLPELNNQLKQANINIAISQSVLNENAALIGSAKLCDNHYYSKLTNLKS